MIRIKRLIIKNDPIKNDSIHLTLSQMIRINQVGYEPKSK